MVDSLISSAPLEFQRIYFILLIDFQSLLMTMQLVTDVSKKSYYAEELMKVPNHILKCSQKCQAIKEVKKEKAMRRKQVKDLVTSSTKTYQTQLVQDQFKQHQEAQLLSEMVLAYKDQQSRTRANLKLSKKDNS